MIPSTEDKAMSGEINAMSRERNIVVAPGDSLQRVFMLRDPSAASLPIEHLVLNEGSKADITIAVLPGVSCDIRLSVDVEGRNAECLVHGICLCPDSENVRIWVDVNHKVSGSTSSQMFRGIAGGSSRLGFNGKITVFQDAQKTEAYQESRNLLLSDTAKVDARPQLEIYADDVKCSHGATIGKLDEEEQFYMRSRGISLKEARVLQMISFVSPVLSHIPESAVKDEITSEVEKAIRQMRF